MFSFNSHQTNNALVLLFNSFLDLLHALNWAEAERHVSLLNGIPAKGEGGDLDHDPWGKR